MVRKRHRYVTVEVEKEEAWKKGAISTRASLLTQALYSSIRSLYGIQGVAQAKTALNIDFLGAEASLAKVTMRRSAYKIVTSALQLVTVLDGEKVNIRTLHTAATIRHSNLFAEKYLRRQIEAHLASAPTEAERENLKILIRDKLETKKSREGNNKIEAMDFQSKVRKRKTDAAAILNKHKKVKLLNSLLDEQ